MAAHTFLSFSSPRLLISPSSTLRPSFGGVSLSLHHPRSVSFSASKKSLTVVSPKKAVAVLKGNSDVEGVVTLTQEDTEAKPVLLCSCKDNYLHLYDLPSVNGKEES